MNLFVFGFYFQRIKRQTDRQTDRQTENFDKAYHVYLLYNELIYKPAWLGDKQKYLGSIPLWLSCLNVVVCGHCLMTMSLTSNETLKWMPSLAILMQDSFWW